MVDSIKELLPQIKAGLPASVDVNTLTDRTETIRASVADVEFELLLAVVLVVLVIYCFLGSLPATFIPSLSVPLSIVGTFAAMYLLGYSLNNLSLMALTISAGFVVDDAIVMIENISRYIEAGETPYNAAMKGAGEIGFTIVSLTVSLIAVLIPLLFMQEVVGRLFREFAVTLAVTILISAVVSLTLVPMLCAKLLRTHAEEEKRESGIQRRIEGYYNRLVAEYDRLLIWVLKHQPLTLLVAVGTLVLTVVMYIAIPKGFFPCRIPASSRPSPRPAPPSPSRPWPSASRQLADKILQGSGCGQPVVLHRGGRHQQHPQQRPLPDQPEAQGPARRRRRGDGPADGRCPQRSRHHLLSSAGAGPDHRFGDLPRPVPVRAAGGDRRRRSTISCPSCWTSCAR